MRRLVLVPALLLSSVLAHADPVQTWNAQALDTIRIKRASDSDAARLYALVNVAMYDAVNGIVSRGPLGLVLGRDPALVPATGAPVFADLSAASIEAAYTVLVALYPDQQPRFDAQLAIDLAALAGRPGLNAGTAWGQTVGAAVVAARANDGSSPIETQPAGSGPGVFRADWSGVQYRNLAPFAIADPAVYVTAPVDLGSLEYAGGFAEEKILGNAANINQAALETFQYWSLAAGTAQPPGEWMKIALEIAAARSLSIIDETRLGALVAMALADTVAPTITAKFVFQRWRPTTAIREADSDGNALTDPDTSFAPRGGGIGSTPEHWSGHSSFSAAGASILAGFFCRDDIPFTHVSDSAPGGQARIYPSFSAAAAEAGRSRVLGGLHFEFSNQAGLTAGRGVATEVLAGKLLRKLGPKHFGACPL
jgi:PAP2 superfamily